MCAKRYLRIESAYLNCVHDLDENDNVVIVHKKDDETIIEHLTIDQAINNFYNLPAVKNFGITKAYIWNFTDQKIDKIFTNVEYCNVEEENDSPYCELCGGCGEDMCCSHLMCFRTLIQNPKCNYGKIYLADAMFSEKLYKLGFNIKEKLKNKEITADEAVIEYEKQYDIIWNEIYNEKEY